MIQPPPRQPALTRDRLSAVLVRMKATGRTRSGKAVGRPRREMDVYVASFRAMFVARRWVGTTVHWQGDGVRMQVSYSSFPSSMSLNALSKLAIASSTVGQSSPRILGSISQKSSKSCRS